VRLLSAALLAWPGTVAAHESHQHETRLPVIGPAPDFALMSQDGARVTLSDFRGKVLAVTFIYASCTDTCPLLTDKMARIQDALGDAFGRKIAFASITVDPKRDTPAVLKEYARNFGAKLEGWTFLTGDKAAIAEVERSYGVVAMPAADGSVDHTFLTSIIDARGTLRVQYLGYRFDQEEFRGDLLSLVDEPE
jgi:protein SCO1/2